MQCQGTTERGARCKRITTHEFCSRHTHQHSVYVPPGPDWPRPEEFRPLVKHFTSSWLLQDWCLEISRAFVTNTESTLRERRMGQLAVVECLMRNWEIVCQNGYTTGLVGAIKMFLGTVPGASEYLELFRRRCDTEYRAACHRMYLTKVLNQSPKLNCDVVNLIVAQCAPC